MNPQVVKSSYRPELEGLRALAVLAVIIYHAELTWRGMSILPGGFLGVDVFFVLSGFLITGILIERQPSLASFYKSRIDRIYPALLLMLLLSSFAAYKFLTPNDLLAFAESLKGALGFYSNYIFMHEDSYVSDSSKYKALLHTWSLGVEWQYYLAFPFVIYAIRRFFAAQFDQVLIFLFALSFFYCLYLMTVNATYAFYSTPSRVWQLFAGGIVFLLSKHISDSKFNSVLSALGLVVIAYAMLFFKDTDNHPGFISFSAVLGSALFILFTRPGTFVYRLSTLKVALFFGVISYSLYLYHQPILVFYRLGFDEVGKTEFIALLPLMVLMAYLSYRFFENPIRKGQNPSKYLILLVLVALVYAFANGAKNTSGYKSRQSDEVKSALEHFEKIEWDRWRSAQAGLNFKGDDYEICNRRMPFTACSIGEGPTRIVVLGDSYAGVFAYSLSRYADQYALKGFHYSACPIVSDPIWFHKHYPECWEINKQRWTEFEKMPPAYIVVGTNFDQFNHAKVSKDIFTFGDVNTTTPVGKDQVYASFRKSIQRLIDLGHKPIIVLQPPKPDEDIKKEVQRRVAAGILSFTEERGAKTTSQVDQEVREALKGVEGIHFIDINKKMCDAKGKCLTFTKDGGLYNSGQHLSYFGVQLFIDDILMLIED